MKQYVDKNLLIQHLQEKLASGECDRDVLSILEHINLEPTVSFKGEYDDEN